MPMLLRPRRTPTAALAASTVAVLLLSGCAGQPDTAEPTPPTGQSTSQTTADSLLESHGLADTDARGLIDQLDATAVAERSQDYMASIRPDSLVISDASGAEVSLEMPADEFYVSIAPFVDQTHECFFHSLTTCRGELANEAIEVEVVDDAGTVLVDQTVTTFDNGFLGLWLPRDMSGTITLELDGRSVTDSISTGADDPTCITTLQLA